MTRTVDLTPTWAGILPALIAALQDGSREGRDIARQELGRLAAAMDSHNAAAKAGAADLARRAEALDLARSCLAAYPAADLERQKGGAAWRDTARDLRDSLAGLVAAHDPAPDLAPAA